MTRLKSGKTCSPFVEGVLIMAIKLTKTNVTQPFCVEHHVNIHFIALVPYVKIDTRKKFFSLGLPPLNMAVKNF